MTSVYILHIFTAVVLFDLLPFGEESMDLATEAHPGETASPKAAEDQ